MRPANVDAQRRVERHLDTTGMERDHWIAPVQQGPRGRRSGVGPSRAFVAPATVGATLPDPTGRWDEVEDIRRTLAAAVPLEGWVDRIETEHREVNDPQAGNVCHAEVLHIEDWDPVVWEGESWVAPHVRTYRKLRAQFQSVAGFCDAQHRAHREEGYDLNAVAHENPKMEVGWGSCHGSEVMHHPPLTVTHQWLQPAWTYTWL